MRQTLEERFWRFVAPMMDDRGCWEWTGQIGDTGYPKMGPHYAHRLSWVMNNGMIPKGLFVCHHCDNPPCVNPKHLFLGTHRDNMQDMVAKGRSKLAITHCKHGHPLNTQSSPIRYYESGRRRTCRPCNRVAVRKYKASKAAIV